MTTILALIKAIPIIDQWVQQLIAAYVGARIASMQKDNLDAIRKAIQDHDQRDLENAIGSPTAGKPSGDAGSVVIDDTPLGVPKS